MSARAFPILCLPERALKNAVQTMDLASLLLFSFCSGRTKIEVRKLSPVCQTVFFFCNAHDEIIISSDYGIGVRFKFLSLSEVYNVLLPSCVEVSIEENVDNLLPNSQTPHNVVAEWQNPGLHIKTWITHFTDISKFGGLYLWVSTCPSRFPDVQKISHVFRDVDVLDIAVGSIENPMDTAKFKNGTDDGGFHKTVSTAGCITFIPSEYESPQLTHQIMIQSFECIKTEIRRESFLNQLLATNATTVLQKYSSNIPWKDLNLFLKLWMAGANPTLNFIQIVCITDIQDLNLILEIILQGIKHQVANPEKIRFKPYRRPVRHPFDFEIEGGFDVVRHDGCRATITIGAWEEQDSYCFKMKIWS